MLFPATPGRLLRRSRRLTAAVIISTCTKSRTARRTPRRPSCCGMASRLVVSLRTVIHRSWPPATAASRPTSSLRPVDKPSPRRRVHLSAPRRLADRDGLRTAESRRDHPGLSGLGRAARSASGGGASRTVQAVVAANTFLPTGHRDRGEASSHGAPSARRFRRCRSGASSRAATTSDLASGLVAAYDAPFPDESYKEGARQFPLLVPATPTTPPPTRTAGHGSR